MFQRAFILVIQLLALYRLTDCTCTFNGHTYAIGETWHPPTFETCVNCTCELSVTGDSEVKCVNKADNCPKLACAIQRKDPNTCCPYCEVRGDKDESSSVNRAACTTSDGRTYKDGEQYPSNSTGIKPTSKQQCVMCVCQNGLSLCHLKTCLTPRGCKSFVTTPDNCCPVCADCADAGGLKKNGTSWHPTVSDFGEIECITCTCMEGKIKCKKNCVPDHELPCPHPKKPNGECCKSCPIGANVQVQGEVEAENKKPPVEKKRKGRKDRNRRKNNGRRNRRHCKKEKNKNKKRCRNRGRKRNRKDRNRKQKVTTPLSLRATTAAPGIDLANLCLKRKRKYLVYKAISDTELLIAFDDIAGGTVDVYRWKVTKDDRRSVISYTEPQTVPAVDFRKTINNTNVVGTTGQKHYRKFKKRLKEKLDKCNSDCQPELFMKILQNVNVHLLKFGEECNT